MATVILERNEFTANYFDKIANHSGVTVTAPSPNQHVAKILFINPMPETNGANAAVERNMLFALGQNIHNIPVEPIILRPNIIETDNGAELIWPEDLTRSVMDSIENGDITGTISFGAGLDHLPFENITGKETLAALFNASAEHTGGLHAICWSSMFALNHFHDVPLSIEPKRIGHFNNTVNAHTKGEFADALRKADVLPTGSVGCMSNDHIRAKVDANKLEILAWSNNMGAHSDFSITFVQDLTQNILYEATHSEYGNQALPLEHNRDVLRNDGSAAKAPINLDSDYTWCDAKTLMQSAWLKTVVEKYAHNDNPASAPATEGHLTLEAQA